MIQKCKSDRNFLLKWTCSHLAFLIFVMFTTFEDEMQYILLEKKFIIMVFLAVKMSERTSFKAMQMQFLSFQAKNDLN